jgi:ElaB/YqjD/DUF883 family membrane-anchored ribosome-binding protein
MRQITCAAMAALLAVVLGCSPRDRQETGSSLDSAAEGISNDVREGAEDVREEFRDYSYDRRDEFRREVDLRLQRLDEEIAELERTTKRGLDKVRDSAVVRIRGARAAVNRNLERFSSATERTWDEVKQNITAAVDSLDLAVRSQRPDARPMGGTGPS